MDEGWTGTGQKKVFSLVSSSLVLSNLSVVMSFFLGLLDGCSKSRQSGRK